VATAAQIEANRRNAQKSTGPKTERGMARAKLNAITHGMTARTIMPVLPQEDPKELEDKTQEAITATKPRNSYEHDMVCRVVRLSWEIDRAERVATAHLAHRVRMAMRSGPETVSADELKKVHDLGSKLFFEAGIELGYPESTGDDYPAVIVRRLEESAEGCRWLLAGPNYGTFWTAKPPGVIRKSSDSSGSRVSAVPRRTSTRSSIPSSMPSMRWATASATSSGTSAEIICRWAISAASSLCPIARSPRRPAIRLRR